MSISDRIKLLLRSEFNALKNSSNKEIIEAVSNLEAEFGKLRIEEEKLIGSIRQRREEANMWEERATLALNRHHEALAKSALAEQNRVLGEIKRLRSELHQTQAYLQDIGGGIRKLRRAERINEPTGLDSYSDAQTYRPIRQHRPSRYSFHPAGQTDPRFGTDETFEAFDRMSESVERQSAEIEAEAELYGGFSSTTSSTFAPQPDPILDPEGVKFEEEYRRIETEKRINDDLADLKSKFES